MKQFYKKHVDVIWWLLFIISVVIGIFIDTLLGLLGCLLIGVHFYIAFGDEIDINFTQLDRFAASCVCTVLHWVVYIFILVIITISINKEEIKVSNSYEIKYLDNNKIIILKDNDVEIIDDAKLYWECRAKTCKNIIITIIKNKPINTIYSKNLPMESSTIYSVD